MHAPTKPSPTPFQTRKRAVLEEEPSCEGHCQCSTHERHPQHSLWRDLTSESPCIPRGWYMLLRKEVIQPHLPVRLPCYDLVLITDPTFDSSLHKGWATGFGCYRLS